MADNTACKVPTVLRAGDSFVWRRDIPAYPAGEGWQLTCTLVGSGGVFSIPASADGNAYAVHVPAATTAGYAAGRYTAHEYVTKGGDRHTVSEQQVLIQPDVAAATVPVDTRSPARKVLDSIDAWMANKTSFAGESQLGDRRIRQYSAEELIRLRDYYAALVRREEQASQGQQSVIGQVLVRL